MGTMDKMELSTADTETGVASKIRGIPQKIKSQELLGDITGGSRIKACLELKRVQVSPNER